MDWAADSAALSRASEAVARECGGPAVALLKELLVCEPRLPIDHRLAVRIQAARAADEFQRCKRCLHRLPSPSHRDAIGVDMARQGRRALLQGPKAAAIVAYAARRLGDEPGMARVV